MMKQYAILRTLAVTSLLAIISLISACSDSSTPTGGGGGGGNTAPASLTWDDFVGPIFQNTASCGSTSCHGGSSPQNNFSVASYASVLAGGAAGPAIVPNDIAASVAYQKLSPTPPFGSRMPLGGPFLAQSTLDSIALWISAGAPESPPN